MILSYNTSTHIIIIIFIYRLVQRVNHKK